jgi:hypothetical protein
MASRTRSRVSRESKKAARAEVGSMLSG